MRSMSSNFQIKKSLLGSYNISYNCPHCSTLLKSPLDDAGNTDTCPQCQRQLVVPGAAERDQIRTSEKLDADKKKREEELQRQKKLKEQIGKESERVRQYEEDKRRAVAEARLNAERRESQQSQTQACPYCGEEILAIAKKCKHCGEFLDKSLHEAAVQIPNTQRSTPKTPGRNLAIGCGSLVVISALVASIINSLSEGDSKSQGRTTFDVQIEAIQLFSDYEANSVAADEAYKDKVLVVTGFIDDIGKDILGTMFVTLRTDNLFNVQCMFSEEHRSELVNASKGKWVGVKGICKGKLGNVILRDCSFYNVQ